MLELKNLNVYYRAEKAAVWALRDVNCKLKANTS